MWILLISYTFPSWYWYKNNIFPRTQREDTEGLSRCVPSRIRKEGFWGKDYPQNDAICSRIPRCGNCVGSVDKNNMVTYYWDFATKRRLATWILSYTGFHWKVEYAPTPQRNRWYAFRAYCYQWKARRVYQESGHTVTGTLLHFWIYKKDWIIALQENIRDWHLSREEVWWLMSDGWCQREKQYEYYRNKLLTFEWNYFWP